jgi:hypothetical protein
VAKGTTNNPALEAWAARSIHETLLPSGTWAKVKVPDPEVLLRGDALPTELVAVARTFVSKGIDTDELTEEALLEYVAFTRELAAQTVKSVRLDGPDSDWTDVDLHADDLDPFEPEDIEALRMIAFRRTTPAIITAKTRAVAGAITAIEAKAVADREAGSTGPGLATFRDDGPGAESGDDGADVRGEPGPDVPQPRRSRARRNG